jgi:NADPH-dependent 2,4-dienoyl-CoA reductase/sulfur reductase-like enzyme
VSLLRGERPQTLPFPVLSAEGVKIHFGTFISKVPHDLLLPLPPSSERYDAVVVATGSRPSLPVVQGVSKAGVHRLLGPSAYCELHNSRSDFDNCVVVGGGFTSLEVSEALAHAGASVTIVANGLLLPHLTAKVRDLVMAAATSRGIRVFMGSVQKVIGSDHAEAVLVADEVVTCDCVVIIPARFPALPSVDATCGPSGGILVTPRMETTAAGVYAAGDCAEYPAGCSSRLLMLGSTARVCGKVAGIGASGGRSSVNPIGCFSKRFFGLSICSAGLGLEEARSFGFEAVESTLSTQGMGAASVVFERTTGRLLGLQLASQGQPSPEFLVMAVSTGTTVEELEGIENTGSTDISPILEAAREGVKIWQKS